MWMEKAFRLLKNWTRCTRMLKLTEAPVSGEFLSHSMIFQVKLEQTSNFDLQICTDQVGHCYILTLQSGSAANLLDKKVPAEEYSPISGYNGSVVKLWEYDGIWILNQLLHESQH